MLSQCDSLFDKIRHRVASNKKRKFCFVYFILGRGVVQNESGWLGVRANNSTFIDLEAKVRRVASEFQENSCHHAVFDI